MSSVMKSKKFAEAGGKRIAYAESGGGPVRGSHFIQEDSGPENGWAIAAWAGRL